MNNSLIEDHSTNNRGGGIFGENIEEINIQNSVI